MYMYSLCNAHNMEGYACICTCMHRFLAMYTLIIVHIKNPFTVYTCSTGSCIVYLLLTELQVVFRVYTLALSLSTSTCVVCLLCPLKYLLASFPGFPAFWRNANKPGRRSHVHVHVRVHVCESDSIRSQRV